jgi:GMP synthase (glutamine-hydrolysing)
VLRPIESQEAMTVNFYPMNMDLLEQLAGQIMAISGIGAVLYDATNKPPATIEWE